MTTPSSSDHPPTAATNAVATNAVVVKIPPFWPADPELWFAQVEAQFALKKIASQGTKFAHVVAALSPEAASEVRDLILTPPATNPFDILKASLTERVSLSKRRKIQQLLHAEELGDRKPSQLLRRLQQLHGNSDSDILRELFLQRLPATVQIGLLSHPDKPLAELALMADGMLELAEARASVSHVETPESAEISSIRFDLNKVLMLLDTRATKAPIDPETTNQETCWYHTKCGARASKCRQPCSFSVAGNDKPGHK